MESVFQVGEGKMERELRNEHHESKYTSFLIFQYLP
jgi:hypothetical protein